jgi:hypothetical protein
MKRAIERERFDSTVTAAEGASAEPTKLYN